MPSSPFSPSLLDGSPQDATDTPTIQSGIRGVIDEVEFLVADLVASWHDRRRLLHPRDWHRATYECWVALTPIDERSHVPVGDSLLCQGRNVSPGGVSFVHDAPLPHRVVAITFLSREGRAVASLATRLNWCRFTRAGTYHSGGKFLKPLPGLQVEFEDSSTLRSA